MAITAANLLVKHSIKSGSAGNSQPQPDPKNPTTGSLGGYISTTAVTDATIENIFDNISGAENAASTVEYRCIFFHNNHATLSLTNAKVFIFSEVGTGGAIVAIATDNVGVTPLAQAGLQAATIATETTLPSPISAWNVGVQSYAGGLAVPGGSLGPGQVFGVWVRRTAQNTVAVDPDGLVIRIEGDTLP